MLEKGYESSFEHLTFRQLKSAYQVNLITVPHDFATLQEGLDAAVGTKVFMVPPGRVDHSTEFKNWVPPEGDLVFCFGSPQENLVKYVGDDIALHITTPKPADMMSVCVAAMVLYVHRQ
jgi:hypothetical protein